MAAICHSWPIADGLAKADLSRHSWPVDNGQTKTEAAGCNVEFSQPAGRRTVQPILVLLVLFVFTDDRSFTLSSLKG